MYEDANREATIYCRKSGIVFQHKHQRYPDSFALSPNSDIFEVFEEIFELLVSSGIALHHQKRSEFTLRFKNEQEEPKVLSCDDLSFGFIVWLVACGISVVGFFLEISYEFILRQLSVVTKNFVAFHLVVAWIKLKGGAL